MADGTMTIRDAMLKAAARLAAAGVDEARSNAELLLQHVLGLDRAALLRDGGEPFPAERAEEWERLVKRKELGEPIQYMIGEQWFYGRPFAVTPAVLIPRPETELLVEAVLEAADKLWPPDGAAMPTVVDVGTGSGAIAVTLASQRPRWRVCASDLSPDALEVARTNAVRHEAADRMAFVQGDLLAPFIQGGEAAAHVDGELRVDVLVSNPPYIPAADLEGLQREVRDYEPHLALDGGADGLDPYRSMLEQLPQLAGGLPRIVAFELGIHQPRIVAQMMEQMGGWDDIRIITDYGGIERHIIATQSQPR